MIRVTEIVLPLDVQPIKEREYLKKQAEERAKAQDNSSNRQNQDQN